MTGPVLVGGRVKRLSIAMGVRWVRCPIAGDTRSTRSAEACSRRLYADAKRSLFLQSRRLVHRL
jgi:hypothetical protein